MIWIRKDYPNGPSNESRCRLALVDCEPWLIKFGMLISIPFTYAAKAKEGRARNSTSLNLAATSDVLVREIQPEEAPIALWWTPADLQMSHQTALRASDGILWQPILQDDGIRLEEPADDVVCARSMGRARRASHSGKLLSRPRLVTGDGLKAHLQQAGLHNLGGPGTTRLISGALLGAKSESDPTIRDISDDDRLKELAKIGREMAKICLIGGVAHRAIDLPLIKIGSGPYGDLEFAYGYEAWHENAAQIRQIDQFQDAKTYLVSLRGKGHRVTCTPPEIVRADLLDLRQPLKPAALSLAAQIITKLSQRDSSGWRPYGAPRVSGYPVEVIVAFMRVRDAHAARDVSLIAEALGEFAEATEPHGTLHSLHIEAAAFMTRWDDAYTPKGVTP